MSDDKSVKTNRFDEYLSAFLTKLQEHGKDNVVTVVVFKDLAGILPINAKVYESASEVLEFRRGNNAEFEIINLRKSEVGQVGLLTLVDTPIE
jgi:hypothetical protein